MDRLGDLQAFVSVVERGSFTAAARELRLSTSAVSKQVRALEERLGARLLNRTTRRLSVTDVGAAFAERVRAILAEVEEAEQAVARLQAEPGGTLRVNAPLEFGRRYLAGPLAEFAARHPRLRLEVDLTDRFVDVVEEGVDLAVRIAVLADSSLVARRLAPARRVLCASPEYLARRGEPHAPADLAGHECIEYAHGDGRRWRFRGERGEETVTIAGRLRTNSGELMRAMAVAGQGIALLPTFLACDDLRAGRLRAVLGERLAGDTAVYAIFPHRRLLSAKVRLLVEHLAASLGPQPAWDEGLA